MYRKRSRQRERLLELLRGTGNHPPAQWLYERLEDELPTLSMGTVYRNLKILTEGGEVRRIDLGEGVAHFEANTLPHHHLVCELCGAIIDVPLPIDRGLDERVSETTPYIAFSHRIEFRGLCSRCRSQRAERATLPVRPYLRMVPIIILKEAKQWHEQHGRWCRRPAPTWIS